MHMEMWRWFYWNLKCMPQVDFKLICGRKKLCLIYCGDYNGTPGILINIAESDLDTSSEWKLFRFDKMEVNSFQILLVDFAFYFEHI